MTDDWRERDGNISYMEVTSDFGMFTQFVENLAPTVPINTKITVMGAIESTVTEEEVRNLLQLVGFC